MGKDSVGGWMYLTESEVIFASHNVNRLIHSLSISLDKINDVRFSFVLGFVPNGLSITTQAGLVEKFVVNNRKNWTRKIEEVFWLKRPHDHSHAGIQMNLDNHSTK